MPQLLLSAAAADRRARAAAWLLELPAGRPALIVGATLEAAADLVREVAAERPAGFGWHRLSLGRLAATLAAPALAEQGLAGRCGAALRGGLRAGGAGAGRAR